MCQTNCAFPSDESQQPIKSTTVQNHWLVWPHYDSLGTCIEIWARKTKQHSAILKAKQGCFCWDVNPQYPLFYFNKQNHWDSSGVQVTSVSKYLQVQIHMYTYSGTSLIWTPLGQKEMSILVRCPDFRDCNVYKQGVWDSHTYLVYRGVFISECPA